MKIGEFFVVWLTLFTLVTCVIATGGGWGWPYVIESIGSWAGKSIDVGYWTGFGLGAIPGIGAAYIPLCVISFVVNLIIA